VIPDENLQDIFATLRRGGMSAERAYWIFQSAYETQTMFDVADEYEWRELVHAAVIRAYELPKEYLFLKPSNILENETRVQR
jgi:hypothetical protein